MRVRFLLFLVAIALMAASVQADLRLWYNFEEGTLGEDANVVVDQSSYGNHGTAQEPWGYGLPEYVVSHDSSKALLFGYDDDQGTAGSGWNDVSIAKSDSLAYLGTMFAMGGWIRVDSVEGYSGTYGNWPKIISSPNYELILHAPSDDASYFWPWDETYGDWDFAMADTNGYEGTWMHMILTYDGNYTSGTFTQYIDGEVAFTKETFTHQYDDTTWDDNDVYWTDLPMKIGTAMADFPAAYGWLIGALDDIAIWGGCYLDADGVAGLYDGTYTPATVPCVPEPTTMLLLGIGGLLLRKRWS